MAVSQSDGRAVEELSWWRIVANSLVVAYSEFCRVRFCIPSRARVSWPIFSGISIRRYIRPVRPPLISCFSVPLLFYNLCRLPYDLNWLWLVPPSAAVDWLLQIRARPSSVGRPTRTLATQLCTTERFTAS